MRRPLVALGLTLLVPLSVVAVAGPARAHGYPTSPPSRQAYCADGTVPDCGDLAVYTPHGVEAPQGSRACSGGNPGYAVLDDPGRAWPVTDVSSPLTVTWKITAAHATASWQYFVGGRLVTDIPGNGQLPGSSVTQQVDLAGLTGRQTILAVWNIADTGNAFYACMDVNVAGGAAAPAGGAVAAAPPVAAVPSAAAAAPVPAAASAPAVAPAPAAAPAAAMPADMPGMDHGAMPATPATGAAWTTWQWYMVGQQVTYLGVTYTCVQSHRSQPDWPPSAVPALWRPV